MLSLDLSQNVEISCRLHDLAPHQFIELPTRSPDAGPYKIRLSLFDQRVSTAAPPSTLSCCSAQHAVVFLQSPALQAFQQLLQLHPIHMFGIGFSYPTNGVTDPVNFKKLQCHEARRHVQMNQYASLGWKKLLCHVYTYMYM